MNYLIRTLAAALAQTISSYRRPSCVSIIAVILILSTGCGAGGNETTTFVFEVGEFPHLVVGAGRGEVLVTTGPSGVITVLAEVSEKDNVVLDVSAESDVITASSTTTFSGNMFGDSAVGNVDFTITVPPLTEIRVGTTNGSIAIEDTQRGGVISSSEGTITLRRVSGEFSGGAGVGDIKIIDSEGSFQFTTGVGGVEFDGDFSAGSFNEFETGVGDAVISIPAGSGVTLDAKVTSGSITSDIDLTEELLQTVGHGASLLGSHDGSDIKIDIRVNTGSISIREDS